MTINIRRVVTGHDTNGKAVVSIDDVGAHVGSGRPHMSRQLIWTTNDLPVHFSEDGEDKGAREMGSWSATGGVEERQFWRDDYRAAYEKEDGHESSTSAQSRWAGRHGIRGRP